MKAFSLALVLVLITACNKSDQISHEGSLKDPFVTDKGFAPVYFTSGLAYHEPGDSREFVNADNNFDLQVANMRYAYINLKVPFRKSGTVTIIEPDKSKSCGNRLKVPRIVAWEPDHSKGYGTDLEYGVPTRIEFDPTKSYEFSGEFDNSDGKRYGTCINFDILWEVD